jgi:N-acetylglucosamine-6-sulfatase
VSGRPWTRFCGPACALLAVAALAAGPARAQPPNIVLIVTDDQRWDTVTSMQTVERELVGRGVTFTNAFVVNALCCPSRASILTGQYSHSTGVYVNIGARGGPAFRDASTIATWLDAAGYRTALVGKYLNSYSGTYVPPGWDRWVAFSGDRFYYDYDLNVDGVVSSHGSLPSDYSTDVLAGEADSFIRGTSGPLFLYFTPYAPHATATPDAPDTPPTPAPRHADAFADIPPWRPANYNEADVSDKPRWVQAIAPLDAAGRAEVDAFRRNHLRALLAVDDAVARILDALADTGRLRNTLVIFTSDNGLAWGEHRWRSKLVAYEESIRVPFVVRYDALGSTPRTEARMVLNIDLAPTLAAAAGTGAPKAEGRSLLPLLAAEAKPWRRDFLVEHLGAPRNPVVPTYCAVRGQGYAYVQYATGEEEVYDLGADPFELDNRAGDPTLRETLVGLRTRLVQLCRPPPPRFAPRSPCLIDGTAGPDFLNGTAFFDYICGRTGSDVLVGGSSGDVLVGGPGADRVSGRWGPDRLRGGLGPDNLDGGPGDDVIVADDGWPDAVRCGLGQDLVQADRFDKVAPECESVVRR